MANAPILYTLPTGLIDEMIDPEMTTEQLAGLNAALTAGLAAEPADGSGPIARDISYIYGTHGLTRAEAQAKLPFSGGDPNPLFRVVDSVDKQKETDSNNRAIFQVGDTASEPATIGPVIRNEWKKTRYLQILVASGGNAANVPLWFLVAADDYGDEVPAALPNSTKQVPVLNENDEPVLDENGEPTFNTEAKTWGEWQEVDHSGPWDGVYYVPVSAGNRQLLDLRTVAFTGLSFIGPIEYAVLEAANKVSEPI